MTVIQIRDYKDYTNLRREIPISFNGYLRELDKHVQQELNKRSENNSAEKYEHGHNFVNLDEDGNLQYCNQCGGLEGSLTTYCPKEKMTYGQDQAVYRGNLDYRENEGWVHDLSPMGRSTIVSQTYNQLLNRERQMTNAEIALMVGVPLKKVIEVQRDIIKEYYRREYEGE